MTSALKSIRLVQLQVAAFNSSQRYVILVTRMSLTGCSILAGFAAINFFDSRRLLAECNFVIALQCAMVFVVLYDKGFSIPRSVVKLKRLALRQLKASHVIRAEEKGIISRELKSVGPVAVHVGDFYHLQRTSTPVFLDTCIKYAVRLVMVRRRYAI